MKRVVGLDLGTSSIGWAVIDAPDSNDETGAVVALGARIFTEGAERDGSALSTPQKARRQKRAMRRQIQRRAQRKRRLRAELVTIGLLPPGDVAFAELMATDPAGLMDRSAARQALTLREIGRVVYWFSTRRGFLSLRSGGGDFLAEDDAAGSAKRFRRAMTDPETGEITDPGQEGRFLAFLRQQQAHHPAVLTDQALFGARGRLSYPVRPIPRSAYRSGSKALLDEFGLHGLVFFQRKVYWPRSSIGRCSLDARSGERVAAADRLAQRYRVWKTVTDLRVEDPPRPLTTDEKTALVAVMMRQKEVSFSRIRKTLRLDPDAVINFETAEKTKVSGNATEATLSSALGETWGAMSETDRDELVWLLIGNAAEEQTRAVLEKHFGLTAEQAAKVLKARFPAGRAAFSRRTLRSLLEVLPECTTEREAQARAGYEAPEVVRGRATVKPEQLTNPLVRQTLLELRRTLHAVAHTHGNTGDTPFDVVRIELSRDVRQNRAQRERTARDQKTMKDRRDAARALIAEYTPGGENSGETQRRILLWRAQREQCLYCGKPLSPQAVLSRAVEVDHVLPRSRTLDNSLGNLAVVCTEHNQDKGDRTITEWAGEDRAAEIGERAKAMGLPRGIRQRIAQPHVPDDAIPQALLVQTGYINAVARDFVKGELGVVPEVSAGRITAQLRWQLGLSKDDSDHRRHGLDAAMIALSDIRTARKLADDYRQRRDRGKPRGERDEGWEPWPGLKVGVQDAYAKAVVSHAVKAKTGGAWFEDTFYGIVDNRDRSGSGLVARRRPVAGILNSKQLGEVADPIVREALEANLRRRDVDLSKKFKWDPNDPPRMPDGQRITKVRCHLNLPGNRPFGKPGQPKTTVTPAGNHSAWIYRNTSTGKWRMHFLSRYEAFVERNVPLRERRARYAHDGEEFLFSVTIGATIELGDSTTGCSLLKVMGLEPSTKNLWVCESNAEPTAKRRIGAVELSKKQSRKVVVLPDGSVRTARD